MPRRALLVSAAAFALGAAGCNSVGYDFFADGGAEPPAGTRCEDLPVITAPCEPDGGVCAGALRVATARIAAAAGCTPPGLSLGLARVGPLDAPAVGDVLVWAEPAVATFSGGAGVSLALFGERCDHPLGGDLAAGCAYEPARVEPAVGLGGALFVHVQTPSPSSDAEPSPRIGYQIAAPGAWRARVPAAGEGLSCDLSDGQAVSDLVGDPPWDGAARELDLERFPPALDGDPWICPATSNAWRQAAFLLRNQGDEPVRVAGVDLAPAAGEPPGAAPFHWAIARCGADGVARPDGGVLAEACGGAAAAAAVEVAPWDPDAANSEHVLVVQVPPGPVGRFELALEVE